MHAMLHLPVPVVGSFPLLLTPALPIRLGHRRPNFSFLSFVSFLPRTAPAVVSVTSSLVSARHYKTIHIGATSFGMQRV